jgi:hypothetical protein
MQSTSSHRIHSYYLPPTANIKLESISTFP